MEIKINSLIPYSGHLKWIEVFGYTSKGNPGLEVTGLNGRGRQLKEKMVFLSKRRRLRFPLKRYVLCLEYEDISKYEVEWLELPMLLAFWSLTENLPLKRLDNCFSSAKVSLEGEISFLDIDQKSWDTLVLEQSPVKKEMISIGDGESTNHGMMSISALSLLNDHIGHFSVK